MCWVHTDEGAVNFELMLPNLRVIQGDKYLVGQNGSHPAIDLQHIDETGNPAGDTIEAVDAWMKKHGLVTPKTGSKAFINCHAGQHRSVIALLLVRAADKDGKSPPSAKTFRTVRANFEKKFKDFLVKKFFSSADEVEIQLEWRG